MFRLSGPATQCILPFESFPDDLRERVEAVGQSKTFRGGHHITAEQMEPLDVDAIAAECEKLKTQTTGVLEIVVVGTFSCSTPEHELEAQRVIRNVLGDRASVTLSHRCGSAHFLKRENASILNASLRRLAKTICTNFRRSLDELSLKDVPLFITGNDGCLMTVDEVVELPVLTLASGPTNSMRGFILLYFFSVNLIFCFKTKLIGAALISNANASNTFVVDIGGTTSDCGVLNASKLPRLSQVDVVIGGVVINSRIPDVRSIALGGGSKIVGDTLLPQSVGHRLTTDSIVFGGQTATFTDVCVALDRCKIGNPTLVDQFRRSNARNCERVFDDAIARIERLIDESKITAGKLFLVLFLNIFNITKPV